MKQQQKHQQAKHEQKQRLKQKLKDLIQTRRPQQQLLLVAMSRVKEATTMLAEQRGDHGLLSLTDALEIVESIRGTYHSDTAKLYVALGGTLQSLHKYPRAKLSYQKAIEIYHALDENQEKPPQPSASGHRYKTQRYIQAWMGLGTTYSHLEKWHEAVKAVQSAARMELYNLVVKNYSLGKPVDSHSMALQRDDLPSVRQLHSLIDSFEKNHSNNRKQVWSRFPHLPQDISAYWDALQTTVQHEFKGDVIYQQGQWEVAQREYQFALAVLQQQVHTSKHAGISLDAIWLLRKQALAELNLAMLSSSSSSSSSSNEQQRADANKSIPLVEIPLHHLVQPGFQLSSCSGFERACEALLDADAILRDAKFDPEQFLRAFYRLEEARVLTKLSHSTQATLSLDDVEEGQGLLPESSSRPSIVEDMKRTLEELRQQLVPNGLSPSSEQKITINTQKVWQELEHLSVLIDAQERGSSYSASSSSTTTQSLPETVLPSPTPPPAPVGVCEAAAAKPLAPVHPAADQVPGAEQGMWFFMVLVVAFLLVAPMFLLRKNVVIDQVRPMDQDKEKDENHNSNENNVIPVDDNGTKVETSRLDPQVTKVVSDQSQGNYLPPDTRRIHVIPDPVPLEESKSPITTTTGSNKNNSSKAIAMLQSLDHIEAELQGMSSVLNKVPDLLANKVSALVCLHKTRQALLARVMGEVEDDDDDDDENSVDIHQTGPTMEMELQTFIQRMQELGFQSLVANMVKTVTLYK